MNAALRIQVIADARAARAQLKALASQLRAIQNITRQQTNASVSASRLAKAQAQVAASSARATRAQHQAAAAAANQQAAYSRAAAAAQRVTQAQNNTAASASRAQAAQSRAAAAQARAAQAQNAAALSAVRLAQAQGASSASASVAARVYGRLAAVLATVVGAANAAAVAMVSLGRAMSLWLTLPIALIAGFSVKWALDLERAMTRLRKVYDGAASDIDLLGEGFRALSSIFGVHIEDVADIGAIWGQAGAQGSTLLKSTRATLEAMILGELNAEEAAAGLITLMSAYRLNADQLTLAVAQLNAVENATAASLQDLIEAVGDAGGVARAAGVSLRELAADAAVLRSAGQSASEAGNALKTVYSRIMAPTNAAAETMNRLGLNINTVAFQSLTASERLDQLALAFGDLEQSAKVSAAKDIFGIRQNNRGILLLESRLERLTDETGVYNTALEATTNNTQALAAAQREINTLLESHPQRLAIATNHLRNMLIDAILPLIPALTTFVEFLASATQAFSELDPSTQKWIVTAVLLVGALGPLLFIMGKLIVIVGVLAGAIKFLAVAIVGPLLAALATPVGAVVALIAVLGVLALVFRDELADAARWARDRIVDIYDELPLFFKDIIQGVIDIVAAGLRLMPESFVQAFNSVIRIVADAARTIFQLLQWLNPFARHSPSLVENVQAGMGIIGDTISDTAGDVAGSMSSVESSLDGVTASLEAQEAALDAARDRLEELRDVVSELDDQLSSARSRLSDWLRTPVVGAHAFEDAIFANEQAQKRLLLQIALLERKLLDEGVTIDRVREAMEAQANAADALTDANTELGDSFGFSGLSADEAATRMSRLQADIERLRGQELDLRLAGAGSDVLGGIRNQIDAADAARRDLAGIVGEGGGTGGGDISQDQIDAVKQIDDLLAQLDKLRLEGEILDLEEALALDPARKAIADTQRLTEQTLDTILNGIAAETAAIESLTAQREAAVAAVEAQEEVVNRLAGSFESLRDAAAGAADEIATGDFEVPGGAGGSLGDIIDPQSLQDLVDELNAEVSDLFGDFDPVGAITGKLTQFRDRVRGWWSGVWQTIKDGATDILDAIGQPFKDAWTDLGLQDLFNSFWDPFEEHVLSAVRSAWADIEEELAPLVEAIDAAFMAIQEGWDEHGQPALDWIRDRSSEFAEVLSGIWSEHWEGMMQILGHFIEMVGGMISGFITFITGLINVFVGLLTGDWDRLWLGLGQIVEGFVEWMTSLFTGFVNIAWDIITTGFEEIWAGVSGVWDVWGKPLFESIISWLDNSFVGEAVRIVDRIISAFAGLPGGISSSMGSIGSILAAGLNKGIRVINDFAGGVNHIASMLGIGFRVPTIGQVHAPTNFTGFFARGGELPASEVGPGFVTDGARAIVGEGNPRHPEFVIPTDPRFRGRALGLLTGLMGSLGLAAGGQIPQYAIGGTLGDVWNSMITRVYSVWDGAQATARSGMDRVGGLGGAFGHGVLNQITGAIGNRINKWLKAWYEGVESTFVSSVFNTLPGGSSMFGVANNLTRTAVDRVTNSPGLRSVRRASSRGGGGSGGSSTFFETGGVLPYIYSLMDGALVKGNRGGVLAHIGDGRHDELVQPLNGQAGRGQRVININGDLVFPNMTDGDDVEDFLLNLEALAESA